LTFIFLFVIIKIKTLLYVKGGGKGGRKKRRAEEKEKREGREGRKSFLRKRKGLG
jgi:hypothetical protein